MFPLGFLCRMHENKPLLKRKYTCWAQLVYLDQLVCLVYLVNTHVMLPWSFCYFNGGKDVRGKITQGSELLLFDRRKSLLLE